MRRDITHAECQTTHWKEGHKAVCSPIAKGTWVTADLRGGYSGSTINRHATVPEISTTKSFTNAHVPQKNVHGTTPFIVKLQHPPGSSMPIMCYDRMRSFTNMISRESNPAAFDMVVGEIHGCSAFGGQKTYRWAKRLDEWHLSICVDVEPKGPFQW